MNQKEALQKQLRKQLATIDKKLATANAKHEERTKAARDMREWIQAKLDELNDAQ